MEYKTCTKCGVKKESCAFGICSGGNYRRTTCKLCENSLAKVRKKLREALDPPLEDHQCPICLRNAEEAKGCGGVNKSPWTLDHDHLTGLFRGWICHSCNRTLGGLKDDFGTLDRIKTYLKKGRV